jgi:hypothetical protein
VTRLAIAGCSVPQIMSNTGHTANEVRSILEKFYLNLDPALADAAIKKLEALLAGDDLPADEAEPEAEFPTALPTPKKRSA